MEIRNRDFSVSVRKPVVWVIAGSDCSGGAGIQADNQVCQAFDVYACDIITAVTAQNSLGVSHIHAIPAETIRAQIESLYAEYPPDVIKLGMLADSSIIVLLAELLPGMKARVVCDPVLQASAGGSLVSDESAYAELLSRVDVLTPNHHEFCQLFDVVIDSSKALEVNAKRIASQYSLNLVITGGDAEGQQCSDFCVVEGQSFWMHSPRCETQHVHGTGCSFASALASSLALGYSLYEAVVLAKSYLNQGLKQVGFMTQNNSPFIHTHFPDRLDALPGISTAASLMSYQYPDCDTERLGLYPVVDSLMWLERCLECGVKTLQLRVKDIENNELESLIEKAVKLGRQYSARLFINDYWQLAIKFQAYGVHLGQEDLDDADLFEIQKAGLRLGVSTHSWFEIARAHSLNPSYIAIGPVYETTTKKMPFAPQGLQQLGQWLALLDGEYPVVAIGGIDLNNAVEVLGTGVGSIAMVRAITEAADYSIAIAELQGLLT